MLLAIPTHDGTLAPHFGGTKQFTFLQLDPTTRMILHSQTREAPPHRPGAFPKWLQQQGAHAVIASGIGQRALDLFTQHNIKVHAGQAGTSIGQLAADFLAGRLQGTPQGCSHHDHHHHHDHHDHPDDPCQP